MKQLSTSILFLLLIGCSIKAAELKEPKTVEQQLFTETKAFLYETYDYKDVWMVSQDLFTVEYIDARQIPCRNPEVADADGCFIAHNNISPQGVYRVKYEIKIAKQNLTWKKSLRHEYCHGILHRLGCPGWESICHKWFE